MQRPSYVSDGIETSASGLHTGRYGPFSLWAAYQPIFETQGRGLVLSGYEGLIRPVRAGQPVSPDELYRHVDEPDRLYVECMARALHLRNYRQASPGGRDLFINVNPAIYESVEVIEREFDFMFSILPQYGLSPALLVCELVEEEAISTEVLARICRKFREHGARIAIDDFGSGASSMARYRTLHPDMVKVDGGMFRELCGTGGGRRMLASIAKTFVKEGTPILVEGIETQAQLEVALGIGASHLQGYGLSRPQLLPHTFPDAPDLGPRTASAQARSARAN